MLSLGSGLSGFSGVLSWPELQLSTCAHGLCRRSSKLGFRLAASRLRKTSVGRKLETKLSGSAELGFGDGGLELDWVGSLWASSSKEKRHGNETVAQG